MRIYDIRSDAPLAERRPAVTLGVFDGVHRGHQAIISRLLAVARERGAPALAITFSPHPRLALGRAAPPAICSLERRLELLGEAGLDAVWVIPFTAELAGISAQVFAEEYFHRRLHAGAVVLGEAAVFGRGRDGNAASLAKWAVGWDMPVLAVPPLVLDGGVVSSTAIRLAVQAGDLDRARRFLGRQVSVAGTVVHGQGHGRTLGFPTLNLDPHHELRPPAGVYLTTAAIDGTLRPSVTNIGRPPTEMEIEAGLSDFLIETHLLDYEGDLYGRTAEVFFHRKIRDVMRFRDASELVGQVRRDLRLARDWFDGGNACSHD
ncbi:MAG: riboflavin biosynthesis protein RibF [Planctomycetes bacterium]|nr:riboflavin biosynthesis protein RibF [Planctomycetota bacterium]